MAFLQHFINIIALCKKNENKINNKKDRGPNYCPSQTFGLPLHVHEGPGDIVGFPDGKHNKYPVEQFKANKISMS